MEPAMSNDLIKKLCEMSSRYPEEEYEEVIEALKGKDKRILELEQGIAQAYMDGYERGKEEARKGLGE
jgi:flagellar biosynthesis/type III secretory pathway protein FliH